MTDLGVDLSEAYPKPLTDDVVRAADVVITMGCGDACPIYPGKRYEDWDFADPGEARFVDEVRTIRDEMDERITKLVGELLAPWPPARSCSRSLVRGAESSTGTSTTVARRVIAHELF